MKISTKGQYALEIVADLALHSDEGNLESLKNIAARRRLSEKYLERIMKALKQAQIVKSVRGAYGGYCLEKKPEQLSVREILNAVEGELTPVNCLTEETDCQVPCNKCPTKATWKEIWETIVGTTDKITIADIIRHAEE